MGTHETAACGACGAEFIITQSTKTTMGGVMLCNVCGAQSGEEDEYADYLAAMRRAKSGEVAP